MNTVLAGPLLQGEIFNVKANAPAPQAVAGLKVSATPFMQ